MKRILAFIALIAMLLSWSKPVVAVEPEKLSEMSEAECIEFIKQNNVDIPGDYDEATWAPFVKQIIKVVEQNPYFEFTFNYTKTLAFANAIKDVVNNYYNISTLETVIISENATTLSSYYTLQDSVTVGPWLQPHGQYNCYIYAIGTPYLIYENPGYFSGRAFSMNLGILDIADLAMEDLRKLGHERVYRSSAAINATNLCVNEQIICVRRGDYDYHFMRLEGNDWYHKPGPSAILKYIRAMSVMRVWNNEAFTSTGAVAPTLTYNSAIIYISYDGHDWNYVKNSNDTHTRSCDICGDEITEQCDIEYTYTSSNRHKIECDACGYLVSNVACVRRYEYTGDGSSSHTYHCLPRLR